MSGTTHVFTVSAPARLDVFLAAQPPVSSRAQAQRLISAGCVSVQGACQQNKKYRLQPGQQIALALPDRPPEPELLPADIPLHILYEDDCLAVVDKPRGMVVHPGAGGERDTLAAALLSRYGRGGLSSVNGPLRPGILHRIDKDTSGLLLVAKTDCAHRQLAQQIEAHTFDREYRAICHGGFQSDAFTLEGQIARSPKDRKKMAVVGEGGRYARTDVQVLEHLGPYSYLKLKLYTGRTHQIRVQLAHTGHPVAGDVVYGPKKPALGLQGQCLHAAFIGFIHPGSGAYMAFESPLPPYFSRALALCRAGR